MPEGPVVPEVPEVPEGPVVPEVPEVPEGPVVPELPEDPVVPDAPVAPVALNPENCMILGLDVGENSLVLLNTTFSLFTELLVIWSTPAPLYI